MRQVQELSITLSLSMISFLLLIFSSVLGSFAIWRDVEKRYTTSVLGMPLSRSSYVLGKFLGISFFILVCAVILGIVSFGVIAVSAAQYRSDIPVHWLNVAVAIAADSLKYILLTAFALLFSSISTSFFFPFFATIAIYLAGSASQEVFEYVSGEYGRTISPVARFVIKGVYYFLPNFTSFNFKLQAIYALPLPFGGIVYTLVYFVVYTAILLILSIWAFARRELP
jgi:ABC-type transport system involved in multi-copper enzyme maturation permease subunit